jgi:hypothetical protein
MDSPAELHLAWEAHCSRCGRGPVFSEPDIAEWMVEGWVLPGHLTGAPLAAPRLRIPVVATCTNCATVDELADAELNEILRKP